MPALRDARKESFAQYVARGFSLAKASKMAGFNGDSGAACRINQSAAVAQRVSELSANRLASERAGMLRATERLALDSEYVLSKLMQMASANILDFIIIDAQGNPQFDFASIDRAQAMGIAELIVDEYKDGRASDAREVKRVRVKLCDRRAALADLGRHLGLFVDPSVLNVSQHNYFSEAPPSMADWKREIAAHASHALPKPDPSDGDHPQVIEITSEARARPADKVSAARARKATRA